MKNKKILLEIIIIPLCIAYLLYYPLRNYDKASFIISSIFILLTCLVFLVKYGKEVYIYEHKYNYLKIISIVFNSILIVLTVLGFFLKIKIIKILFLVFACILLLLLLGYAIVNIKPIITKEKNISQNILNAFLSLASVAIILTCGLIYIF